MTPLHPDDRLRLAADRAHTMREIRAHHVHIRPLAAARLRDLAAWLDPPPPPAGARRQAPQLGALLRR